jgi:hypothetical protein
MKMKDKDYLIYKKKGMKIDHPLQVELEGVEPSSGDGVVTLSSC